MKRPVGAFFSLLLCISPALAQHETTDNRNLSHAAHVNLVQQIDGSINPELIPDSTAYRLFFVVNGLMPDPSETELARQHGHLQRIGLVEGDTQALTAILNDFRVEYAELIKAYNEIAEAQARVGKVPDYLSMLAKREMLVNATRDKLQQSLTLEALEVLHSHIQGEKRGVKLFVPAQ